MSDFKMIPVPESKLGVVYPLIDKVHGELNMPKLATSTQAKKALAQLYPTHSVAAYVDSLEHPQHLLILSVVPGHVTEGLLVIVHLIYSVPEARGDKEKLDIMHKTIDNYALIYKAGKIAGSSWLFNGSRGIDQMWLNYGYQIQETSYVKEL